MWPDVGYDALVRAVGEGHLSSQYILLLHY